MNETPRRFDDLLRRRERICGFVWLPIHVVVLPLILVPILLLLLGEHTPSAAGANVIYYLISFTFVLIAFWNYLRECFGRFVERIGRAVVVMFMAYGLQLVLSLVF